MLGGWSVSPQAKRVALELRGDIWTVPAKSGFSQNLTPSDGYKEENPAWSPDGEWIAYCSDESGERRI
jgi:tricorn protease